jgi:uncharacterized protein with GYD domain
MIARFGDGTHGCEPRRAKSGSARGPFCGKIGVAGGVTDQHEEAVMAMYMLLCNFTEQGIRGIKDAPKRRAAAREAAKKLGVEIKASYLAMGIYDLIIHLEAKDEETLARFVLSLAGAGNLRTTTLPVFSEAQFDKIAGSLA